MLGTTRNFGIDAPGATSARLQSLGHTECRRPIYPLEPATTFEPHAVLYRRWARGTALDAAIYP